jgi:hypothetical protein
VRGLKCLRHRSRRRIDLMNSHVRFAIAVRRDVSTAAAIALNSFAMLAHDPPKVLHRHLHNSAEAVPPSGGLLLHHLETSVASLPRSITARQKWRMKRNAVTPQDVVQFIFLAPGAISPGPTCSLGMILTTVARLASGHNR